MKILYLYFFIFKIFKKNLFFFKLIFSALVAPCSHLRLSIANPLGILVGKLWTIPAAQRRRYEDFASIKTNGLVKIELDQLVRQNQL
jgi:hypothetical protein